MPKRGKNRENDEKSSPAADTTDRTGPREDTTVRRDPVLHRCFDLSPDLLCIADFDGYMKRVNPAFGKTLGYAEQELLARPFYDFLHPDDREATRAEIEKLSTVEHVTRGFENRYRSKDGRYRWINWSATLMPDDGVVFAVGHDVTERKELEERLRESEEKYRGLYESMKEGVVFSDIEGRIVDANQAYLDMLGYTLEEVRNLTYAELTPERWRGMEIAIFRDQVLERGYSDEYEKEDRRKDGTLVSISLRRWLIHDEQGEPAGLLATVRDITDRKRAEDRYRTIVKTAMDGFWMIDMQGRFLDVNDAYCELTGYTREELLLMGIPDIEALESREETADHIRAIADRGWDRFESRHSCKDGRVIDVEISVNYFDIGEGRMFVFTRDITDRKRAERELQMTNTELEGFAHSVSHDLRGPINNIGLACEAMRELVESCRPLSAQEQMQEMLEVLSNNVRRSSDLIEDLLELAEAGQVPRDVSEVDVGELVKKVIDERAGTIVEKGITVDVAKDLGRVTASHTHVYQLFANLIDNAIKHNDSGSPRIEISRIRPEGEGERRYRVRDNGSGIPPGDLSRIFVPFFKGKTGYTGIGLATVEKIIKLYDGEIEACNDGGACFDFAIRDFPG